MNRFKKELRKKGVKLECDYPMLPYFIKGKSCFEVGYIFVDGVSVDAEKAEFTVHLNILNQRTRVLRNGNFVDVD